LGEDSLGGAQFDSIDLTNKNGEEKITFCVSIYTSFAYKKITGRNLVFAKILNLSFPYLCNPMA